MEKQFVYSLDEERYYDLDDILEQIENENLDIETIYRGIKIPYTHSDFICGKEIIESIKDRAYEQSEEYSGNYISQFDDKSKTEHKDYHIVIERLIAKYLDEVIPQPNFFKVENIKKVLLSEIKKVNNEN